ncbi:hypothetical protein PC41400_14795 [Paenibacillus chitinolyticus]|nr:LytTR family transcriptional regulator DNA-binding domain-containing protein [Paenibacillus chitinolyticus]QAV18877.1 hypothetical protein PC41400_14795 [Paenibacillus chitinolyticus]
MSIIKFVREALFNKVGSLLCESDVLEIAEKVNSEYKPRTIMTVEDNALIWIDINDILFVDKPGKETMVHTITKTYKYHDKHLDLIGMISEEEGFLFVDKRLAINIPKIKKFDSKLRNIYFTEADYTKHPFVAGIQDRVIRDFLKTHLSKDMDVCNDRFEYSPIGIKKTTFH